LRYFLIIYKIFSFSVNFYFNFLYWMFN